MKAIIFSPGALFKLSQYTISQTWFGTYELPSEAKNIKRVPIDDFLYLIDSSLESDADPIIVIQISDEHAVFSKEHANAPTLDRIITVVRSVYTTSVAIPTSWRPFREGHRLSISASSASSERRARILFDVYPNGIRDVVVFGRTEGTVDISRMPTPLGLHKEARSKLAAAILTAVPKVLPPTGYGIVLSERLPQGFTQGATLSEWIRSKLTDEQRSFVSKAHDGPVRLRGAAGTGKTLSLVVKFLKDGQELEKEASSHRRDVRLGFITHSTASSHLVTSICESLDSTGIMFGQAKHCQLEVRTLYELAHEQLKFALEDLEPLSLDGREGRQLQRELIDSSLKEMRDSKILSLQHSGISENLKISWNSKDKNFDREFVTQIMSEFANVLDAEGIRSGEELGERYAKGTYQRPKWLIPLPTEEDRRFVLEVHRIYRRRLGEMDAISVDQMVADFNNFLNSNRWDRRRGRDGYDALFVDELHLFTSIERQILHKMIKASVEEDGRPKRPPIFMAYDLKQSPRGLLANDGDGSSTLFTPATKLQNADLILLDRVFRYTPEIAEFLADLDATFPAINIPDDWGTYIGESAIPNGDVPTLSLFKDDVSLFRGVFSAAHQAAKTNSGGGRRVAVLCISEELFDLYLSTAVRQFEGKFVPIVSREGSTELQHAGKRFIFTMPEFVAGLQFETVFLLHVDSKIAPLDASVDARQRFVSSVYLGCSRAERTLQLSSSLSSGGPSDILEMPLKRKSLRQLIK